jgi:predicted RNase H-like HicB family nuclease
MKVRLAWEEGVWIASIPEVPGCHTYGVSVSQAMRRVREALGLFRQDPDHVSLEAEPLLPPDLQRAAEAGRRALAARDDLVGATQILARAGLSRRDTAVLLGISHQRVQRLLDTLG